MSSIKETLYQYAQGLIDKAAFIQAMYENHHAALFDYAGYLSQTNIKKIEIEDQRVIMTSRDRGIQMECTPGDFRIAPIEILNFFDYEKDESAMMENLVSDGDSFFDIGANIGWYSINMAMARRAARVYCFEPVLKTYRFLQKNLELNRVTNVTAHNFGFSNQEGEVAFYTYPEGSSNASSANLTGRSDVETQQCRLRTLDDYVCEKNLHVDFIKCDVEGAELMVFQGGIKSIERDLPIVFSEILRKWSARFNYNPNEIFRFFRGFGYRAFTVKGKFLSGFGGMDDSTPETNFFFLHQDRHEDIIRRYAGGD